MIMTELKGKLKPSSAYIYFWLTTKDRIYTAQWTYSPQVGRQTNMDRMKAQYRRHKKAAPLRLPVKRTYQPILSFQCRQSYLPTYLSHLSQPVWRVRYWPIECSEGNSLVVHLYKMYNYRKRGKKNRKKKSCKSNLRRIVPSGYSLCDRLTWEGCVWRLKATCNDAM